MRTECPECQTAFRVTAPLLRQAHGQVRCGDCGHVFDALDHLFEDAADDDAAQDNILPGALQDLRADDDVRIEDTGVEWRVLNVTEPDNEDDSDAANSDEASATESESSWSVEHPLDLTAADDGTQDDAAFAEASDVLTVGRGEDDSDNDATMPPDGEDAAASDDAGHDDADESADATQDEQEDADRHADDEAAAADSDAAADAEQQRFDDDTPLPDDFVDTGSADAEALPATAAEGATDDEESLHVTIDTGSEEDWQELLDEVEAEPAGAAQDTALADAADEHAADEATADTDIDQDAEAAEAADADEAAETGDDLTDEQQANADGEATDASTDEPDGDTADDESLVQSIVMEGETVTDLLERAERPSYDDAQPPEFDDDTRLVAAAGESKPANWGRIAGYAAILLLILALAAQLVHANRDVLVTRPVFQQTVAPVYAAIGQPVQPAWDVRGWQFESTSGSTDEANEYLTIYSKISNHAADALPYPLLHLSLTDRFDEVIGSRVLTPRDYLAGATSERPVPRGGDFTAVIVVSSPSTAATGFKLNVCYPMSGGQARCAIEDFRD